MQGDAAHRQTDANIPVSGPLPVSSPTNTERLYKRQAKGQRKKPQNSGPANFFIWLGRIVVLAMIVIAPWCFGAVSQAAQSWLFILALIGLAAWWFAMVFGNQLRSRFPLLAIPVMLGLLLIGFQMWPLNASIGQIFAPHQLELYEQYSSSAPDELLVDKLDPIAVDARITMDIDGTAKMFNLLTLALTCLILSCNFFSSRRFIYLLPFTMMVNGVLISLYGIIQQLRGDLTIYGIAFEDIVQPIGPFVNRNNAAGFLLICLSGSIAVLYGAFHSSTKPGARTRLVVSKEYPIWKRLGLQMGIFIADLNAAKILAMMGTFIIAVGILFSVSRGGILALGIGSVSALIYYSLTRRSSVALITLAVGLFLMLGLLGFAGVGEQLGSRFDRLSDVELVNNDERVNHWLQTSPAIREFVPLGSGLGSYLNVHRLYRADNEDKVFYFAENQYFQTLVESGFPGLLLLLTAIAILIVCVRFIAIHGNSPKTASISLMGVFLIPSQLIAALFDFGLFIPANTILMATVCGFLAGQAHALADRIEQRSFLRFKFPKLLSISLMLGLFSVVLFSTMSTRRYANIEKSIGPSPQLENYLSMDLEETDQRIQKLKRAITQVPDSQGLLRLAELYLYRYRIQLFDLLTKQAQDESELRADQLENVWLFSTGLDRLHRLIYEGWNSKDQVRISALIRDPLVREDLLPAAYYLELSRSRSPLNPAVHALLGQVHAVSDKQDADLPHFERAESLAPANANIAFVCGIFNLQANRTETACKNFARCLQIDPGNYRKVISVALPFITPEMIAQEILPDQIKLLFDFAENQMTSESLQSERSDLYRRIKLLSDQRENLDRKSLEIKSEVEEKLGKRGAAIKTRQILVAISPDRIGNRFRLVNLMLDNCEFMINEFDGSQLELNKIKDALSATKKAWDDLKRKANQQKSQERLLKARKRLSELTRTSMELSQQNFGKD